MRFSPLVQALFLILFLSGISVQAIPNNPYVVYGYAEYPDKSPAPNIPIIISTTEQSTNTITNDEGKYIAILYEYTHNDNITVKAAGAETYGRIDESSPATTINITIQSTANPQIGGFENYQVEKTIPPGKNLKGRTLAEENPGMPGKEEKRTGLIKRILSLSLLLGSAGIGLRYRSARSGYGEELKKPLRERLLR